MSLTMHQASAAVFQRSLNALSSILDKADAHVTARKIDPKAFLDARLSPDMYPFTRQVQLACDFAKNGVARLAGVEAPKHEDKETSFAELKARIAAALAFIESIPASKLEGSQDKDISLKIGGNDVVFKGSDYLLFLAMPNFYFHYTTAYDLLRHGGVEVGKRDFVGAR